MDPSHGMTASPARPQAPAPACPGASAGCGGGLSRRDVLRAGATMVPAILGVTALVQIAAADAARASEPVQPAAAPPGATTAAANPPNPDYDPTRHAWGFVCDTTTCIGCGHCVVACKAENGVPTDGEHTRTWIELHVVDPDGKTRFSSPEGGVHGFEPEDVGHVAGNTAIAKAYFVPRLCMQCENPPCVNVCPVSATYRVADGVTLVDEQRCIGCGFCMVACPYGARYIVPNTTQAPKGVAGVVDKCTLCYHRITRGQQPACVDVCPVNARVFGDLNDPGSTVSEILRTTRTAVMKPSLGTRPRVHFVGIESEIG